MILPKTLLSQIFPKDDSPVAASFLSDLPIGKVFVGRWIEVTGLPQELAEPAELQRETIVPRLLRRAASKFTITVFTTCSASFLVGNDKAV